MIAKISALQVAQKNIMSAIPNENANLVFEFSEFEFSEFECFGSI